MALTQLPKPPVQICTNGFDILDTKNCLRIIGEYYQPSQDLDSIAREGDQIFSGGKSFAMNEGLIITLLIVNVALSGAALLGVFVVLGMVRGGEE